MIPSIFEPVGAGIAVAIFNKYILNKLDPLAYCYTQCCPKDEEEDPYKHLPENLAENCRTMEATREGEGDQGDDD